MRRKIKIPEEEKPEIFAWMIIISRMYDPESKEFEEFLDKCEKILKGEYEEPEPLTCNCVSADEYESSLERSRDYIRGYKDGYIDGRSSCHE